MPTFFLALLLTPATPALCYTDGDSTVIVSPIRRAWSVEHHWHYPATDTLPEYRYSYRATLQHIGGALYVEFTEPIQTLRPRDSIIDPEVLENPDVTVIVAAQPVRRVQRVWLVLFGEVLTEGRVMRRH